MVGEATGKDQRMRRVACKPVLLGLVVAVVAVGTNAAPARLAHGEIELR